PPRAGGALRVSHRGRWHPPVRPQVRRRPRGQVPVVVGIGGAGLMKVDLLVKDCRVVKPDAIVPCSLAIRDGTIAGLLAAGEPAAARRTIDAGGRHVLPGLLDTHIHLGNAAQSFAADCATESRHAVTGGVTTMFVFVITRGAYAEALPGLQRAVREHS